MSECKKQTQQNEPTTQDGRVLTSCFLHHHTLWYKLCDDESLCWKFV